MKIAYVILTYNRILDAKIQMEIIRNEWSKHNLLKNIDIYHSYNGQYKWYPNKYLEDEIIRTKNNGHLNGVISLINDGVKVVFQNGKEYDYLMVVSSDVWILRPEIIQNILRKMKKNKILLATTQWFLPNAISTEFFIIDFNFSKDIFPIDYAYKSKRIFQFLRKILYYPVVELALARSVANKLKINPLKVCHNKYVYLLDGREFLNIFDRFYSPKLGYLSHHNIDKKTKILKEFGIYIRGKYSEKLLSSYS